MNVREPGRRLELRPTPQPWGVPAWDARTFPRRSSRLKDRSERSCHPMIGNRMVVKRRTPGLRAEWGLPAGCRSCGPGHAYATPRAHGQGCVQRYPAFSVSDVPPIPHYRLLAVNEYRGAQTCAARSTPALGARAPPAPRRRAADRSRRCSRPRRGSRVPASSPCAPAGPHRAVGEVDRLSSTRPSRPSRRARVAGRIRPAPATARSSSNPTSSPSDRCAARFSAPVEAVTTWVTS
jgi:hypothetical protein